MDSPTRILVPALRDGASFSVMTRKRTYLFLWAPDHEDPDPKNVWTIVHGPFENARPGDKPWTARCHREVAWLTALRCFAEGITEACGLNGQYVGYYDKTMAAEAIQKAWRRYAARTKAPAVLAKARVLQELRLLPPGGPTGTFASFAGGSAYKTLANKYRVHIDSTGQIRNQHDLVLIMKLA